MVERKLATVLFVDLVGSTDLIADVDPEVVRRRVGRYFDQVSHCVTTHGGTVEKFAGDAVMAAFGVPLQHEDDAERAVRAALVTLDRVGELGLDVRIGIESGEVVADESESTFATGEAVNLAARLEQQAGPNEIIIGPTAARLVRDLVELEPLDPIELRGWREPIAASRVVGAREPSSSCSRTRSRAPSATPARPSSRSTARSASARAGSHESSSTGSSARQCSAAAAFRTGKA
jgi:class 3 adenylate cyclase